MFGSFGFCCEKSVKDNIQHLTPANQRGCVTINKARYYLEQWKTELCTSDSKVSHSKCVGVDFSRNSAHLWIIGTVFHPRKLAHAAQFHNKRDSMEI